MHGDPALLSRALVNLLGNAVDYSAAHTRIACSVELADDGASVRCVIRDDGYGIAAEDQARLFERYRRFRLPGQPTRRVSAGMAFAKAVVDRHRGEIHVRSARGGHDRDGHAAVAGVAGNAHDPAGRCRPNRCRMMRGGGGRTPCTGGVFPQPHAAMFDGA